MFGKNQRTKVKIVLAIILSVSLVFGLIGCGKSADGLKQEISPAGTSKGNPEGEKTGEAVTEQPQTQDAGSALNEDSKQADAAKEQDAAKQSPKVKKLSLNLYFANKDNSAVPHEKREVTIKDGAIMRAAIEALIAGPVSKNLRKTIPDGTKILGLKRQGNVAVVDFSKEFKKVNDVAEIVERASVVNTLTEIPGIEKVKILVEGKDLIGPSGEPFGEIGRFALDENGYPKQGE